MMNKGWKTRVLGSMKMFKINRILTVVTMIAAMAATSWGHIWDGSELDGLWNTPGNWDDGVPNGDSAYITNGASVTLSGTAGNANKLYVNGGSALAISTDLGCGNDLLMDTGGTVSMNAGTFVQDEKFKLFGNGAGSSFIMNGGTVTVGNKLEIYSGSVLELNGGNLAANDGDGVEFVGGTIRVNGSWTGTGDLIYFEAVTVGNGAYEFNPTVGGEIAPITSLSTAVSGSGALSVNLDALTAPATMTLFQGGSVGTFSTVTITQGATTLSEGTAGSLGLNEYALIYTVGTGLALEVNVRGAGPPGTVIFVQ